MNATWTLHVLTGRHTGAQCEVTDGMVIGHALSCDVVLTDPQVPARAGRIRLGRRYWCIDGADDESKQRKGRALKVYGIAIMLQSHAAPRKGRHAPHALMASATLAAAAAGLSFAGGTLPTPRHVETRSAPSSTTPHQPSPSVMAATPASVTPATVSDLSDVQALARRTLRHYAGAWAVDVTPDGQLRITGVAADDTTLHAAQSALSLELPGVDLHLSCTKTASAARAHLEIALAHAGLRSVSVQWAINALQVRASLMEEPEEQTLRDVLDRFNRDHADAGRRVSETGGSTVVLARLPFDIDSVSDGAAPHLRLTDGTILLPGGWHRQYRLRAVLEDRIEFDRPMAVITSRPGKAQVAQTS